MGEKIKIICWTTPAKRDLQAIYDYYSQHSVNAAEKIVNHILDKTEILCQHPSIGQREELLKHKADLYRYLVEGNYKIIYRIKGQTVVIDSVFDCRQNPVKMKN